MTDINRNLGAMSDQTIRTHDFRNDRNLVTQDKLNTLLNKEGVFSIDDQGRLTVINPPRSRDFFVFRFIKGLFNAEYKAEQNRLDRMEALQQNASFNRLIRDKVLDMTGANFANDNANKELISAKINQIYTNHADGHAKMTVQALKEATLLRQINLDDLSSDAINNLNNPNNDGIPFQGEVLNLAGFINKFKNPPADTQQLNANLVKSLQFMAVNHPDAFKSLGLEQEATKLKTLLAKPDFTVNDSAQVKDLLLLLTSGVRGRLENLTENMLGPQKTYPETLAKVLENTINEICKPYTENNTELKTNFSSLFKNIEKTEDYHESTQSNPADYRYLAPNSPQALASEQINKEIPALGVNGRTRVFHFIKTHSFRPNNAVDNELIQLYLNASKKHQDFKNAFDSLLNGIQDNDSAQVYHAIGSIRNLIDKLNPAGDGDNAQKAENSKFIMQSLVHYMTMLDRDELENTKLNSLSMLNSLLRDSSPVLDSLCQELGTIVQPLLNGRTTLESSVSDPKLEAKCQNIHEEYKRLQLIELPGVQNSINDKLQAYWDEDERASEKQKLIIYLAMKLVEKTTLPDGSKDYTYQSQELNETRVKDFINMYYNPGA
ncbi:MAG: hypothetical protein K6F05_02485 [Succinivibrio sp.]|nr:hypothetical protein [Succinivibrio sp.]